jgi:hypothetical protein
MKQALWIVIAMYLLGIGPCGRRIERIESPRPRVRLLPIFRPGEDKPKPAEVSSEIKWDSKGQYIVRKGVKHYVAWVGETPVYSCSGGSCGAKTSIIRPGE